jgi:GMP synthase-like glutamine amidotransferase
VTPAADVHPPICLIVQHVEPEGPYLLGRSLTAAGIDLDLRRVHLGDAVPGDAAEFAAVVVMGGPMSAREDTDFPSRRAELALLRDAVSRGVPTLGICLGAQLLALAGGGEVLSGLEGPEIGWGPVRLAPEARHDPLFGNAPEQLQVLHWHGDTFTVPPAGVRLAASRSYENQAFRLGGSAWGLQFHIEVDNSAIQAFIAAFGDEAALAGSDPLRIAGEAASSIQRLGSVRDDVFARFIQLVRAR